MSRLQHKVMVASKLLREDVWYSKNRRTRHDEAILPMLAIRDRVLFQSPHPDDWAFYAPLFADAVVKITGRISSRWTQIDHRIHANSTSDVLDRIPAMNQISMTDGGSAFNPLTNKDDKPDSPRNLLFFPHGLFKSALETIRDQMSVQGSSRNYQAHLQINQPADPLGRFTDYLVQLKLVLSPREKEESHTDSTDGKTCLQRLTIEEALQCFVEDQIGVFWPELERIPDDVIWDLLEEDWSLGEGSGFGFFVESENCYRIWSRKWMDEDWEPKD